MKVSQLTYNKETDRYELNGYGLHCGECFEALVWNELMNVAEWVPTRIESNKDGWYLVGLVGYQINGLFVREQQ